VSRSIAIPLNERRPLFLTGDEIREHRRREDHAMYMSALRDLMGYFDRANASKGEWSVADVKRLEEIRLLSIGV
jgi:hypothetical protein